MINFIKNIVYFISFLRRLVKYKILSTNGIYKPPIIVRLILFCTAPLLSFKKNTYSTSQSIRLFLKNSGPVFVKLGQMLATRPDIVGIEIAKELESLQDKMDPFSFEETIEIFEKDLTINPLHEFQELSKQPIASASVAQVYKCKTKHGQDIAIKILRPNIRKEYIRNINFLFFVASLASKLKFFRHLRPTEVIENFKTIMHKELNMNIEASTVEEFRENLKSDNNIVIPYIYWEYVSDNILVMEWITGIAINKIDRQTIDSAILDQISKNLAHSFFQQAFYNGFFHADLHHGNILILSNNKIGLIDFGITSRLTDKDKMAVVEILYCFMKGHYSRITEIHIETGIVSPTVDKDLLTAYTRKIGRKIVGIPVGQISFARLLQDLMIIVNKFSIKTQPQLFFLQKTILTVEGIGQYLSPGENIWKMIDRDLKRWAARNISPEAKLMKKIISFIHKI